MTKTTRSVCSNWINPPKIDHRRWMWWNGTLSLGISPAISFALALWPLMWNEIENETRNWRIETFEGWSRVRKIEAWHLWRKVFFKYDKLKFSCDLFSFKWAIYNFHLTPCIYSFHSDAMKIVEMLYFCHDNCHWVSKVMRSHLL